MRNNYRLMKVVVALTGVLALGTLGWRYTISAQGGRGTAPERVQLDTHPAGVDLPPSVSVSVPAAALRTNQMMVVDDQAGSFPRSRAKAPAAMLTPTIDPVQYAAMKANADVTAKMNPNRGARAAVGPLGPPGFQGINVAGVNQTVACSCWPPDTHGAVGNTQYVQIVNSRVVVYDKVTMAIQSSLSLNAFLL